MTSRTLIPTNQTIYNNYRGFPIEPCSDINTAYNTTILDRNIELVTNAVAKHSQVLLLRLDLRYPANYNAPVDNSMFMQFIAEYRRYLARHGWDPQYLWCREINSSENFHMHIYILLDANKIRWMPNQNQAYTYWAKVLNLPIGGVQGLIHHQQGYIKRDDPASISDSLRWLSYFAKNFTKSALPSIRMWGSSVISK